MEALSETTASAVDRFQSLLASLKQATGMRAGAVLRADDASIRLLASEPVQPRGEPAPAWLASAVDLVRSETQLDAPLIRGASAGTIAVLGLQSVEGVQLILAAFINTDATDAETAAWLRTAPLVFASAHQEAAAVEYRSRLQDVLDCVDLLSTVNAQPRFRAAAMAICNEVALRWRADRVSLGTVFHRRVRVAAMSHTERLARRSETMDDLERVMEECADQDIEVFTPAHPEEVFVSRVAASYSAKHAGACVCSLPLRVNGEVAGVLVVERPPDSPLAIEELARLRVAIDLTAPRFHELARHDRWIGARAAAGLRKTASALVGPRHTWAKLTAVIIAAVAIGGLVIPGKYRVESGVVIQPGSFQTVSAPFEGFIDEVLAEPGTRVVAGETVLATLDTTELTLDLARQEAGRLRHEKQADIARRERDEAGVQIARAEAAAADAEARWLRERLSRARIVSPVNGVVLRGELEDRLGTPVRMGDPLFEIAPEQSLVAELRVPDSRIDEIATGQRGQLASASHPGDRIGYTVTEIRPVAELIDGVNVFRVRVELDETRPWMAPGVEGLAKTGAGTRPLLYIWTKDAVNWVRMRLWI